MSIPIPSTQRAWCVVRRGDPSQALVLDNSFPVPKNIPAGSVLVKINASALNPGGYKFMKWLPVSIVKKNRIPEFDFAGQVIDPNGSDFKVDDEVFGIVAPLHGFSNGQGTLASYIFVSADHIVLKPPNVSFIEASGLAGSGLTAYHALFGIGKLEPGQSVFINGGSTSIGVFAIQLAKSIGCRVYASASGKNEKFVRDLGADEFFDYTLAPLHEQIMSKPPSPRFHVILEAVGFADPALYISSEVYLVPNGVFVSVLPQPNSWFSAWEAAWHFYLRPRWAGGTRRAFRSFVLQPTRAELEALQRLVAEGKVKPVVDSVYKFEDALQAYEKMMSCRATGKLVVEVTHSSSSAHLRPHSTS